MKFLLIVIAFIILAVPSYGQEVRVLPINELFQNLEAVQSGADLDVVRAGRGLHDYTVVEVPAGVLDIRHSYMLVSDEDSSLHLVVTNMDRQVEVRNTDGNLVRRNANVRITFHCNSADEGTCRRTLRTYLKEGVQMQSLGVPNLQGQSSLPEKDMIFSFRVSPTGKLRW